MKTLTKALVGTAAAGAMAVSSASPAFARDNGKGIDAGDVIAGALVIGGIAAIVAATSKNDRNDRYDGNYRYDRAGYNYSNARYGYGDPNQAARQCALAAEQNASRYGRANVTDIRSVRNTKRGYTVKGNIAVNDQYRGGRQYANYGRGYDTGTFTCKVQYGRIADLDYSGIRGL